MGRNAEVVRQWSILREIERTRGAGATIDDLAEQCEVSTRTIRRDLQALQEAGFPLYDEKDDEAKTHWKFDGQVLKGLSAGLTLSELSALYFSRALVETLAGTPFRDDVTRAFEKLAAGLTPHMKKFLDQLPQIIAAKPDPIRVYAGAGPLITRLVDASFQNRVATIRYHSEASQRTKSYLLHPYRLAYAQGGLYLEAYVPEYRQMRTFAVERIEGVSLGEDRFTRRERLSDEAFPDSLGVHSGKPERVVLAFTPAVAAYVRARQWHTSQACSAQPDGSVAMTLDVTVDRSLESWILGFGPFARVVSPRSLADRIARQLESARLLYVSDPGNRD